MGISNRLPSYQVPTIQLGLPPGLRLRIPTLGVRDLVTPPGLRREEERLAFGQWAYDTKPYRSTRELHVQDYRYAGCGL